MMAEKEQPSAEIIRRLNEHGRRIRLLEERFDRITENLHSLEEAVSAQADDLKIGLERISKNIKQIDEKFSLIKKEIESINKTLEKAATKDELRELKNFIDIFNPITSKFVTKEELERMLEEFNNLKKKDI